MSNSQNLKNYIIDVSEADNYEDAFREWDFTHAEIYEDGDHCPCGQPIKELCVIENRENGYITFVGNECINKFMQIDTGNIFDGLKRIMKDNTSNPNNDLINYAYESGYLYDNEKDFLMNTCRKRILSQKQVAWKQKINYRIVNGVKV